MTSQIPFTEGRQTQLEMIRDLMLQVSVGGRWLTLAEIAEFTEFGEASISAQLRHLRKPSHGRYRVEKRPRHVSGRGEHDGSSYVVALWEYRVLPPGTADSAQQPLFDMVEAETLAVAEGEACRPAESV